MTEEIKQIEKVVTKAESVDVPVQFERAIKLANGDVVSLVDAVTYLINEVATIKKAVA
jgi:hypothetical protein